MNTQLVLIDDTPADWQLPDDVRQVGRRGVLEARRVLAVAAHSDESDPQTRDSTQIHSADQAA